MNRKDFKNMKQLDLVENSKNFHTKTAEYTFFKNANGAFTKIKIYSRPYNKSQV